MSEPYRPTIHFSPAQGWMNDPNGLIRLDGLWHMFFQHHPDGIDHDDMHWGHAVSEDLVSWTERPVALAPDALGTCFSGSAVETPEGEVKMFYTAHSLTADGRDHQVQCLVHADRALTHPAREPRNPVLPNPGVEAFRDPKVIWHAETARWIMLVTLGQEIGFYSSDDLLQWQFESRFGEADVSYRGGVWECPDLLQFETEAGTTAWVLIVGMQAGALHGGSGTFYFVGDFDGHSFTNHGDPDEMLWMDYGRDYYAAQTFFDPSDNPPVAMAWVSNWDYARTTPTEAFRGVMSLPRKLSLIETPKGLRLRQRLPAEVAWRLQDNPVETGTFSLLHSFDLAPGEEEALAFFGEAVPQFILTRLSEAEAELRCLRAPHPAMAKFAHDFTVALDWPATGALTMEFNVDRGIIECANRDGTLWITSLFYPADPAAPLRITPPAPVEHKELAHG